MAVSPASKPGPRARQPQLRRHLLSERTQRPGGQGSLRHGILSGLRALSVKQGFRSWPLGDRLATPSSIIESRSRHLFISGGKVNYYRDVERAARRPHRLRKHGVRALPWLDCARSLPGDRRRYIQSAFFSIRRICDGCFRRILPLAAILAILRAELSAQPTRRRSPGQGWMFLMSWQQRTMRLPRLALNGSTRHDDNGVGAHHPHDRGNSSSAAQSACTNANPVPTLVTVTAIRIHWRVGR